MKKSLVVLFVLIIAALSVMAVSADQVGNKHWCNSDSYGCWVTDDDGGQMYIMFWSEAARDYIMGPGSNAPLGTKPGTSKLGKFAPEIEVVEESEGGIDDSGSSDSGGEGSGGEGSGGEGSGG